MRSEAIRGLTTNNQKGMGIVWGRTIAVFIVALLVYSLAFIVIRLKIEPTGDEPHYLVIMRSITYDFDLDVANNYADRHWKGFYGGDLTPGPHASTYGDSSAMASIHPIGLPLLSAPLYFAAAKAADALALNAAWAGYLGSVATVMLVASCLVAATYCFVSEIVDSRLAALIATFIVFFLNPILPYSSQIFPEVPGALAIVLALWFAWREPGTVTKAIVPGAAIAALPWLHLRYVPAASLLLAYILFNARNNGKRWRAAVLGVICPLLISGALHGFYFATSYGSVSPFAGYKGSAISAGVIPTGFPGLFLDQSHGLFAYAPIYAVVLVAWVAFSVSKFTWRNFVMPVTLTLFIAEAIVSASHYVWHGGWSIPPRFLVSVLPLAALPLAVMIRACSLSRYRLALSSVLGCLVILSLTITLVTAVSPDLYYNRISSKLLAIGSKRLGQILGKQVTLGDYWPLMIVDSPVVYRPSDAYSDRRRGAVERDQGAPYKETLSLQPGRDPAGFATGQSWMYLRSGQFTALAQLKTDDVARPDVVAVLEATIFSEGRPQPVARSEIRGTDFAKPDTYQSFGVGFVYSGLDPLTVNVYYTAKATIGFGGIVLERQSR